MEYSDGGVRILIVPTERRFRVRAASLKGALACLIVACGLLIPGAGTAAARSAASPIIFVNFFANGQITVTTADGSALGTTSGTPTAIPAGYYTFEFSGPGGCSALPYFHLSGPGTDIVTNGNEGQVFHPPSGATLLPSSTYSWTDAAFPDVVYQFSTTAEVVGEPPPTQTNPSSGSGATVSSQGVVGSALLPFLGSLSGTISASGKVSLLRGGKPVTSLKAGRYTLNVVSKSPRSGFVIERQESKKVAVARGAFSGKRSVAVSLTAGTWVFMVMPGKSSSSFAVS